jgi:hypothetical protein
MMEALENNMEITRPQSGVTHWIAPIARWSVWTKDSYDIGSPDVSFIEATLRRKLSSLAKMSLKVANECAGDAPYIHLVYASRHGDLNRTTKMLIDLADGEQLSPTSFSMSVLNAIAGVYSISKNEQLPSTSLSAGESSFGFGLLEACMQLASHPEVPVLFVYSDEPAPPIYEISNQAFDAHAVAMLLSNKASIKVACEMTASEASTDLNQQSYSFLDCLNGKNGTWQGEGRSWTWNQYEKH